MNYSAKLTYEDGAVLVEFPDCPGCVTEGDDRKHAEQQAREALEGWLETQLQEGELPPRPSYRGGSLKVEVAAALSLKLLLRWARDTAGLTQTALAKKLGVSQQMIAKLEHPDYETKLSTAEKVFEALGETLVLESSASAPRRRKPSVATTRTHAR